jgi:dynein heavy chain, axonemal
MTMMFEVEDLTVASPATVSRCGMVYMEPESMGLSPLVSSWLEQIPENCRTKSKTFQETLRKLFDTYLEPCIEYLRLNLKETVATKDNNLCQSLCRILDCYLSTYVDTELKKVTPEEIATLEQ